jgi:hypothetical protein
MTSREIQMGIVQEFLAHYTSGARLGKRVFAEETLIAAGTQVQPARDLSFTPRFSAV